MNKLWRRIFRQFWLIPAVALGAYYLAARLPLPTESEAKHAVRPELYASYRADLGLGQPLGFLRPWEKLFAGQRLGTSAEGVTGDELLEKLGRSLEVGALGLVLALIWASAVSWLQIRNASKGRVEQTSRVGGVDFIQAAAFGTPVFILALLVAPYVVEAGHFLPEAAAAFVTSIWPGVFLGGAVSGAIRDEMSADYLRTAVGKGLSKPKAFRIHLLPNALPAFLDALPPLATALLAGSFAAEKVLGLPNFGQLYVSAVLHKQLAVVVVATTVFAAILVLVRSATEVCRWVVNPKAREGGG